MAPDAELAEGKHAYFEQFFCNTDGTVTTSMHRDGQCADITTHTELNPIYQEKAEADWGAGQDCMCTEACTKACTCTCTEDEIHDCMENMYGNDDCHGLINC
jgi:hypothetical protein